MKLREQLALGAVLVWRSIRVIAVNPLLLVYPVASFAAAVGSVVALGAVLAGRSLLPALAGGNPQLAYWLGVADVAVALLGGAVLTTAFNVGLVHLAIRSLRKEAPRLRDGLYKSLRMFDRVAVWGVVSSTVGPVAQVLERVDRSGRLVDALLGGPWSSAAFLVAPVVAFEDTRLTRLFERSRQLYRKSWGYTEGASLGVDLVLALAAVPLVVVGWYARTAALAPVTAELLTAVAVVGLLALGLLRQIAVGVSKAAVYIHATTNRTPRAYTGVDLSTVSWGRKARED